MASYLSPGVYVEELSSGVKPITGVGTSNGAFVGIAEKGPIGEAKEIPNWARFVDIFGGFIPNGYLAYAVKLFFDEGGTKCFVVRTCHYTNYQNPATKTAKISAATLKDADGGDSMRVSATSEGRWGDNITIDVNDSTEKTLKDGFNLIVKYNNDAVETHENLTMEIVEETIKSNSKYIRVEKDNWDEFGTPKTGLGKIPNKSASPLPLAGGDDGISPTAGITLKDRADKKSLRVSSYFTGSRGNDVTIEVKHDADPPTKFNLIVKYGTTTTETHNDLIMDTIEALINNKSALIVVEKDSWVEGAANITGSGNIPALIAETPLTGGLDDASALSPSDFEGDEKAQNGLHAFDMIDDINIVAMPDMAGKIAAMQAGLTYCMTRKDCFFIIDPAKNKDIDGIKTMRNSFDNKYGAMYYPWIIIYDPITGSTIPVPPSGAAMGTYAYVDATRGVHKAPAGTPDGFLDKALDVEKLVSKGEHDGLHQRQINVIRKFPTSGICIWGAYTLSSDAEWKYINIRRLFLYLEESLDEATQWVVFEPNDPKLWGSVIRNVTAFLLRVWRSGALFGSTPDEAFFVKVDAENNPPEVRDAGQLIIDIGVAPVKPAEFVIIRIMQKTLTK
ncbi:MAG: phage tail sheath subtilisin-like domain-containing protein [Candidatus Methanoperedens sp.]|nr:phage tail sheath subtilisin-like domain-containing protein [Candidatus Methanoperedens sp.]MCZ7369691.1 phage tail sheath subtilisin-like domain-containing protein [Candidatus Methanoperedens sp.]